MKAICYILIHPTGPKVKKIVRTLNTTAWLKSSDEEILEHFAPTEAWMEHWRIKGYHLCNWHVVDFVQFKPTVDEVIT